MRRELTYLFFFMAALSIPSFASAEENSPVSSAIKPIDSVLSENEIESLSSTNSNLSDLEEATEINDEGSDIVDTVIEVTDETIEAPFHSSIEVNVNEDIHIKAKADVAEEVTDSIVEVVEELPQTNIVEKDEQKEEITDLKHLVIKQIPRVEQQPDQSTPKNKERNQLSFINHPVLVGPNGLTTTGHTHSTAEVYTTTSIYGFIPEQLVPTSPQHVQLADKVYFYFDQWLNAPPSQPPEKPFFFSNNG